MSFLLGFAFLVGTSASLSTGWIYHADPVRGDDANDGRSAATAFRTLARATKELRPGDTLSLAAGAVFHEALVLVSSGTATAPIVIRGNGAVVSGKHPIDPEKWEAKGEDLWFQPSDRCWGALRPRVYIGEEMICPVCVRPDEIDPQTLKPRTAIWQTKGVFFRAEPGKAPRDYALLGGAGRTKAEHSGVIIDGKDYVTVDDLTAEGFPNDGFNVHGTCRGILFRNIVARNNGDDGFSIHEDVMATVIGLHSHHNDYGIQDVGVSQTIVSGAVLEENRLAGFDVYGGVRILRDAVVRGNGRFQLGVRPTLEKGKPSVSPMGSTTAYFENVRVEGGDGEPLRVEGGVTVTAKDCSFAKTAKGPVFAGGRVHLEKCSFADCGTPAAVSPECTFTQVDSMGIK